MRIQLIIVFMFSFPAAASSDKEMADLFKKYDAVMMEHKVELIDEVFSQRFLVSAGGKKEFSEGVKELPKSDKKSLSAPVINWKKGVKDEIWLVKRKVETSKKKGPPSESGNQFIIVKENGKLKIDGTMSDAE
jgi:hypothetical protein